MLICQNCQVKQHPNARVCSNCGQSLVPQNSPYTPPPQRTQPPQPPYYPPHPPQNPYYPPPQRRKSSNAGVVWGIVLGIAAIIFVVVYIVILNDQPNIQPDEWMATADLPADLLIAQGQTTQPTQSTQRTQPAQSTQSSSNPLLNTIWKHTLNDANGDRDIFYSFVSNGDVQAVEYTYSSFGRRYNPPRITRMLGAEGIPMKYYFDSTRNKWILHTASEMENDEREEITISGNTMTLKDINVRNPRTWRMQKVSRVEARR